MFGPECPPIKSSVEDWKKLKAWAILNDHELVLVSAQREHCIEPTDEWLKKYGFDFKEKHYTQHKWAVDVDVLIDDSPAKLKKFNVSLSSYNSPTIRVFSATGSLYHLMNLSLNRLKHSMQIKSVIIYPLYPLDLQ